MKRKLTFILTAFLLSAAFTLMSCGNDDENNNTAFITPDGKVDVARAVEFRVNFSDYTSEEELQGTRAAKTEGSDTLSRQYVELNNGLLAEVTVQKDTAKTQTSEQRPVTRVLSFDTYTMLAYKDGVLRGEITGVVKNGKFTATGSNGYIILAEGTYDFVLFNSKVTRNGDNLTVSRDNVDKALIGRTQYTVTTQKNQAVTFNMKHAGSRLSIKLTGYMSIMEGTAATLSSVAAAPVPNTAVYNAATGTWSYGAEAAISGNLTFPASKEAMYRSITYTSQSNYMYFLPSANPSKLKLTFTGGTIYNKEMKGAGLTLSVPTLSSMKANASYVINVNLVYNFIYLLSNGDEVSFKGTKYGGGGDDKIPVGVVLRRKTDPQGGLAIALKDAKYQTGIKIQWWYQYSASQKYKQQNYRMYPTDDQAVSSYTDLDGYRYTWESNSDGGGSSDIKAEKLINGVPEFPAFYYAGHYDEELKNAGINMTGSIKDKKWHLASNGEWKYVFTALGFGNESIMTGYRRFYLNYSNLMDLAFTQVNGTTLRENVGRYCTSTEYTDMQNCTVSLSADCMMAWNVFAKTHDGYSVRPFIKY